MAGVCWATRRNNNVHKLGSLPSLHYCFVLCGSCIVFLDLHSTFIICAKINEIIRRIVARVHATHNRAQCSATCVDAPPITHHSTLHCLTMKMVVLNLVNDTRLSILLLVFFFLLFYVKISFQTISHDRSGRIETNFNMFIIIE
jgi:hypothetical protein